MAKFGMTSCSSMSTNFSSLSSNFLDNWTTINFGLDGYYLWSVGDYCYFSWGTYQYYISKIDGSRGTKTWYGLTNFYGCFIWTYNNHIYYSNGSEQYELDINTSTWTSKSWNGYSNISGLAVWTDNNNNLYYSGGNIQLYYDSINDEWVTMRWYFSSQFSLYGYDIWSDGQYIYYSSGNDQYVLDISTSTWNTKTWNGLSNFAGGYIWSDNDNIYYSNNDDQYILNISTSTWISKTWTGLSSLTDFNGTKVWSNGDDIYLGQSNSVYSYILDKSLVITYNITTTLTNLTSSGDTTIDSDDTATVTLSANSGYALPSSITVTNAQYTYDSSTGVISLSNATDDVTISASGVKIIISSFNELEVIDHTEYITLTIGENSINIVKEITPSEWDGADLTGTSWRLSPRGMMTNCNIIHNNSYLSFYINYDCSCLNYTNVSVSSIGIVSQGFTNQNDIPLIQNAVSIYADFGFDIRSTFRTDTSQFSTNQTYTKVFVNDNFIDANGEPIFINISGGTDVTNQDLISWLQSNATLISW